MNKKNNGKREVLDKDELSQVEILEKVGLTERQREILKAVVESYISTSEPVGSRTLSKMGINFSPATIRNEMADLEEMGYLQHPHTSAGRTPTDSGYRYYVEQIMPKPLAVQKNEVEEMQQVIIQKAAQAKKIIREIAELYTKLLNYTVFALPDDVRDDAVLKGVSNLLDFPEYNDKTKLRTLMKFLDDPEQLRTTIPDDSEGVKVIIGKENKVPEMQNSSMVMSKISFEDGTSATIGFIGPTRMDYSKTVRTLEIFTEQITRAFGGAKVFGELTFTEQKRLEENNGTKAITDKASGGLER